jgi:REP element-mobilizing transposase RayT
MMARKPRIHFENALYHVICRGNNREEIFLKEEDKKEYLNIIKKYKIKYNFKLYAYCLMDNHAHLLIEVEKIPLSKIMQGIQQVYTMKYNKKNNRSGHVFEQRYKSILCDKENYLLAVIKYIHENPLKAALLGGLNYKWSSHQEYINCRTNNLVDSDIILKVFSEDKAKAVSYYLSFMNTEQHVESYRGYEYQEILDEDKGKEDELKVLNFGDIIDRVCKITDLSIEEIAAKKRTQRLVDARKAVIILSKRYTNLTNKEIANRLNISEPTVSNIISAGGEGRLEKIVAEFEKEL